MNPLAHHRFGPPLQTARFDDQYIGPPEAQNLAGWLAEPLGVQRLRGVLFTNMLCAHLACQQAPGLKKTANVIPLLLAKARRVLQDIVLYVDDDGLADTAAATDTALAEAERHGSRIDMTGLPRPFRPGWFSSPDRMLQIARRALGEPHTTEHLGWLGNTAHLARDTAHRLTTGLLAPGLQLIGAAQPGMPDTLLLDLLAAHLAAIKRSEQKAKTRRAKAAKPASSTGEEANAGADANATEGKPADHGDAGDRLLQVFNHPLYLNRVQRHLKFLIRCRDPLLEAVRNLPAWP